MTEALWERLERQSRERHEAQVVAGLHDDECEWGPRIVKSAAGVDRQTNMLICHCAKRRRFAEGFTEPPGPLLYLNPDCPRCGHEVYHDGDGFICDNCKVSWDPNNADDEGSFTDDYGIDLGRPVANQQVPSGDPA